MLSRFCILEGLELLSLSGLRALVEGATPVPLSAPRFSILEGRADVDPLLARPSLIVVRPSALMASLGAALALELPLPGLGV